MSNIDQTLVDFLFNQIFTQYVRYEYFSTPNIQHNSIWNKSNDEKNILEDTIKLYKKYYSDKAEELKIKVSEQKEANITSYLTYDTEYYVNQYNDRMEEINKYLVNLENKSNEDIMKEKLNSISPALDTLFPNYMPYPVLIGAVDHKKQKINVLIPPPPPPPVSPPPKDSMK